MERARTARSYRCRRYKFSRIPSAFRRGLPRDLAIALPTNGFPSFFPFFCLPGFNYRSRHFATPGLERASNLHEITRVYAHVCSCRSNGPASVARVQLKYTYSDAWPLRTRRDPRGISDLSGDSRTEDAVSRLLLRNRDALGAIARSRTDRFPIDIRSISVSRGERKT